MFLFWRKSGNKYFLYAERRWLEKGKVMSSGCSLGQRPYEKLLELGATEDEIALLIKRLKPPPGIASNNELLLRKYLLFLYDQWSNTADKEVKEMLTYCAEEFATLFNLVPEYQKLWEVKGGMKGE